MYSLAKSYRKDNTKINNIKNTDGEVLVTATEINARWTDYFKLLLNVEQEQDNQEDMEGEGNAQILNNWMEEEEEFTIEEFERALAAMKNGKAPGVDEIGIELIKEAGAAGKNYTLKLLNMCWRRGSVPEEWGKTVIVPIYKGKGDSGVCSNYRGISLINHVVKLYERLIERRLRERLEPQLG
jgi:hypothetical protein